jgi:hypothetical protein
MTDDEILALAPIAASRLRRLTSLTAEDAAAFCAAADRSITSTVAATGELFSPDPVGPELSRAERGTLAPPDAASPIAFQFDARGRLRTSWNRSRFFHHEGSAIDEIRLRGRAFQVGVRACYALGPDGAVTEWASINAENNVMACAYARGVDGRVRRVLRAATGWPAPQSYAVSYADGEHPDEIVVESTGDVVYWARAVWTAELLGEFATRLRDDAVRAIQAADRPWYCLAIAYDLTSSRQSCSPWLVAAPESLRTSLAADLYHPLRFSEGADEPASTPLSTALRRVGGRLALSVREPSHLEQLARAYRGVATALNEQRAWEPGARMPEHFVVFATDYENEDPRTGVEACITPYQDGILRREGLL